MEIRVHPTTAVVKSVVMKQLIRVKPPIRLKDFNPDYHAGLDKDSTREKTTKLCQRIGELQELLHADARYALVMLLQGMDASGKDGVGKRVLEFVSRLESKRPTSKLLRAKN